ncbi:putative mitochondrial protein AtMg00310 [Apium graveolens]|uniref:putative mitochondrial protein AtMg00310 n=1 Tax=Apium graveolens TaxID=4045 RepID=UPI003D7A6C67
MRMDDDNSLYLGLPSMIGHNKSAVFRSLKDKMRSCIQGWDGKWFSVAGKKVLIKMVLQSIPTYIMSVFLLPNKVCRDIEGLISTYWWKSLRQSKGIYWRAWERLSTHKFNGGMGFKNITDFNLTMVGTQGWRLVQFENSLISRFFKEKYYPHGNFLSAQLGRNPSYVWRSIREAQTLLKRGARWRIGDGCDIHVLEQHWLIDSRNPFITTQNVVLQGGTN